LQPMLKGKLLPAANRPQQACSDCREMGWACERGSDNASSKRVD
jgi:hypothetical protein